MGRLVNGKEHGRGEFMAKSYDDMAFNKSSHQEPVMAEKEIVKEEVVKQVLVIKTDYSWKEIFNIIKKKICRQ